ncbi:MAG: hypothetical protein Q9168_004627 [Polycauliona sp. 1 TL-2023]
MSPSSRRQRAFIVLLLSIYLSVAYCATIPSTNRLFPASQNETAEFGMTDFHCVHDPHWKDNTFYFDLADCFGTPWYMESEEKIDVFEPEVRREFKTRTAKSNLPPGDSILTPRKYVVGQRGGMAVAMWGTGSTIDRRYPSLRPVVNSPSLRRPESVKEMA